MNELIYIIFVALSLFAVFCMHKYSKEKGLLYSIIILNIMSYILSFKLIYIFKTNINLGIVPFVSSFTALYIFLSKNDDKEIKKVFLLTIYANIFVGIMLTILNYYIPTITDNISININSIFNNNYIMLISFPIFATLSQYAIYKFFKFINEFQNNIFLTVIITYIITSIIYTIIFSIVNYTIKLGLKDAMFLGIGTYINGLLMTIISTIFIYFITKKKVKK